MNLIVLMLSFLGFFLFFRRLRKDLHPAFYPALTVSSLSMITCLGGIFGILPLTGKFLFLLGLVFLAVFGCLFLRNDLRNGNREELSSFLWMAGSSCVLFALVFFLLRGRFLVSYDDFSHWGISAKILLTEGRLPVSGDDLIFPSYPLGSASFIFFCSQALGTGAEAAMTAQAIMLVSMLISLQAASNGKHWGFLLTTVAVTVFMCYNTRLDTLSVDNLLGASFLSAMLLFFRHGDNLKKHLPELMLILSGCVLIKNSGLFLALGLILIVLFHFFRKKERFGPTMLILLFPLVIYAIWRWHLSTTFTSYGKHYMSLGVYYGSLREKWNYLGSMLGIILPIMVSPMRNHALWLIPAYGAVLLASPPEKRVEQKRILITALLLFVLYEIGILGMYIGSMGLGEFWAQNGGDYARYNGTIICVLAGVLLYMTGSAVSGPAGIRKEQAAGLLAGVALAGVSLGMGMAPLRPLSVVRQEHPDAWAFSEVLQEAEIPKNQPVTVLLNAPAPTEYLGYMAEYYLPHTSIRLCGSQEAKEIRAAHGDALLLDLIDRRILPPER